MDVKCNNLSFGDPNWIIPIGEETLELQIQMSRSNHYKFMDLRPLKSRITIGKSSELTILTNLALKCRNLILGDPNEMIPIPSENRIIELSFS